MIQIHKHGFKARTENKHVSGDPITSSLSRSSMSLRQKRTARIRSRREVPACLPGPKKNGHPHQDILQDTHNPNFAFRWERPLELNADPEGPEHCLTP
jgi:hypothetical protein